MQQQISQTILHSSFCFCSFCCSVLTLGGKDFVLTGHISLSQPTFMLISCHIFPRIKTNLVWHIFDFIAGNIVKLVIILFPACVILRNLKASLDFSPIVPPEVSVQAIQVPKADMGCWKSVKKEQPMKEVVSNKDHRKKKVSSTVQVILSFYFSLISLLLRITVCFWLSYLGVLCCF